MNGDKEFSWRFKNYVGVEGKWFGPERQFTLRVVVLGLTFGLTGGLVFVGS